MSSKEDANRSGSSDGSSCMRNYAITTERPGVDHAETTVMLVNLLLESEKCDFRVKLAAEWGRVCGVNGLLYIPLILVTGESNGPLLVPPTVHPK